MKLFQVDAFTSHVFGGNPACVVPLDAWLPDETLLKIAKENGVAETAYYISTAEGYHLRWFTPEIEIDLCGHATLATAHVLFEHFRAASPSLRFMSASGMLTVTKEGQNLVLDFPSREPLPAALPLEIKEGLNIQPTEVYKARDYVLLYESEEAIRNLAPTAPRSTASTSTPAA